MATVEDFDNLASAQRGAPERAMERVQMANISQLYGWMCEHVGDLTHRMSEKITWQRGGYSYVKEKVDKCLNSLNRDLEYMMPFEQDYKQQITSNWNYWKQEGKPWFATPEAALEELKKLAKAYADEHRKLPTFNEVQKIAQRAAIALGEFKFNEVRLYLMRLQDYLKEGKAAWEKRAMQGLVEQSVPQPQQQPQQTNRLEKLRQRVDPDNINPAIQNLLDTNKVSSSNWYRKIKLSQNVMQQYNQLQQQLGNVNITGSGQNQMVNILGRTINVRQILNDAVNKIKQVLIQKGVKEINTDPLPPDKQGLAISHEPGKIHIDVQKIVQNFTKPLSPVTQFDGAQVDQDALNDVINRLSQEIMREVGGTAGHEAQHMNDFWNAAQNGQSFTNVQEAPGPAFENKVKDQYFRVTAQSEQPEMTYWAEWAGTMREVNADGLVRAFREDRQIRIDNPVRPELGIHGELLLYMYQRSGGEDYFRVVSKTEGPAWVVSDELM